MIDEDKIKAANRVLAAARAWHAWSPEKDGDDALSDVESALAEAVEAYEDALGCAVCGHKPSMRRFATTHK